MDISAHLDALAAALLQNDTAAMLAALEALEQLVPPEELTELVAPLLEEARLLSLALLI